MPSSRICWSCRGNVDARADALCLDCGAPLQTGEVQRLRYLIFLCHEIKKHEKAGRRRKNKLARKSTASATELFAGLGEPGKPAPRH